MHARILIAIAALGVAGCGSSAASQQATQKSNVQTVEQSGGGSQSSSNQSNSGGNTNSTTQSSNGTTIQSSGSVSEQTSSAGGATLNSFTGSGGATIRIKLATASRLLWSNTQGSRFTLHSDDGSVSIDSTTGSGETRLPAGSHQLQVSGSVWTLLVRPS